MPNTITSLQNPRVKNAVKLRDRRGREKQKRILIDGTRELRRALESGVEMVELFCCRELCENSSLDPLLQMAAESDGAVLDVSLEVFAKLSYGERAEGILGVAHTPRHALDDLSLPERPLLVVLENIEKPGNVGAVVRSADGAGASAVILADPRTDIYNPNAIRASLGAIFTLPVCAVTNVQAFAWLRQRDISVYSTKVNGAENYTTANFTSAAAVVLGNESSGLSAAWDADDVSSIRLPMLGLVDSLNVSATAAVLLYEALRQRTEGNSRRAVE